MVKILCYYVSILHCTFLCVQLYSSESKQQMYADNFAEQITGNSNNLLETASSFFPINQTVHEEIASNIFLKFKTYK